MALAFCELVNIIKGKVYAIVQLQWRWVESHDRCRESMQMLGIDLGKGAR